MRHGHLAVPLPIRLLSSDLDGTLLGNPEATRRFAEAWAGIPSAARPLLVYNTGRTVADARAVAAARGLPEPDFVIGSLGTEFHDREDRHALAFRTRPVAGWDVREVARIVASFTGVEAQPSDWLNEHKSSWYWARASAEQLAALRRRLVGAGIDAAVIYSCRYFLDVIPTAAGKGNALRWLCARLGLSTDAVAVAGDTGNDADMFLVPGIAGILVGNALPELRAAVRRSRVYVAQASMADGVIEGLVACGVVEGSPRG